MDEKERVIPSLMWVSLYLLHSDIRFQNESVSEMNIRNGINGYIDVTRFERDFCNTFGIPLEGLDHFPRKLKSALDCVCCHDSCNSLNRES